MTNVGISMYFTSGRVRMLYSTIVELDYPRYIHLRVNESKKQLFIEKCERDKNSFHIIYDGIDKKTERKTINEYCCHFNSLRFLSYISRLIGVPEDSPSLRFPGRLLPDSKTIYINLNRYVIVGDQEKD